MRIAYVVARVDLYHPARLNTLHNELGRVEKADLHVIELGSQAVGHPVERVRDEWGFGCTTLTETSPRFELRSTLSTLEPDSVVITGYSRPLMRTAAAWARANGACCVLASDTNLHDRQRSLLKEKAKSLWIRRYVDAAFVAGTSSATYVQGLGVGRDRIWRGYDVVDNDYFATRAKLAKLNEGLMRESISAPNRYFLFVGRLAPEKNVYALLEAYRTYRTEHSGSWGLVIGGSGPEEASLKQTAETMQVPDTTWAGYVQPEMLPAYYGLGEALVLPSLSEPWGLVVNEAMASGLPVLVSDRCGSAPDLVVPRINGYTFNPKDTSELARLMGRLESEDDRLTEMGTASQRIISDYTPETWAKALADCIACTLERRRRGSR